MNDHARSVHIIGSRDSSAGANSATLNSESGEPAEEKLNAAICLELGNAVSFGDDHE